MLDTLDQIPWSDLSHAYGEAEDVPHLLRDLASPQDDVRKKALYAFYGNIWHQGTVYEATAYAVPFLIELLTVPTIMVKSEILHLLQTVSHGNSYLDVHQHMDHYRNERETEEFQTEREQELDWVRAAHEAVLAGTPTYLTLLSHPQVDVRTVAPYVLSSCVERRMEIEPELRLRANREKNLLVKSSLLLALTQLELSPPENASSRQDLLRFVTNVLQDQAEDPLVRFVAALDVVVLGGEDVLESARQVLRETMSLCADDFSNLPWELGETPIAAASAVFAPYPFVRLGWLLEMMENPDAEIRGAAIDEIEELCRERRFAPHEVVIPLARLVADGDATVRQQAAKALPNLGSARHRATPILTSLQNHPDLEIRLLAEDTLAKAQAVRDKYVLENWLKKPNPERSISECIRVLSGEERSPDCAEAATTLEFIGLPAREAVPALRQALQHESHWVRVRAARALWKITRDPAAPLPILQEEIQYRPAGLLALDCLGDMGRGAESVIPALRQIIDSELRLVDIGSLTDWIDEDEAFCAAAQRALDRIQSALNAEAGERE